MKETSIGKPSSWRAWGRGLHVVFEGWLRRLVAPACFTVVFSALLINPLRADVDFAEAATEFKNGKYDKAKVLLEELSKHGDANAQTLLGYMLRTNIFVKKEFDRAIVLLRAAADQGNSAAQYDLGLLFEEGIGFEASAKKAVYWLKKSAQQGHTRSKYLLGLTLLFGNHLPDGKDVHDIKQGQEWLASADRDGYAPAASARVVGLIAHSDQIYGEYPPKVELAERLWSLKYVGDASTLMNLGYISLKGFGVNKINRHRSGSGSSGFN